MSARDHLSPEAVAAAERGRADAQRGWAARREARIARGLPPTREQELGRSPRFLDPESEAFYLPKVLELGLGSPADTRTSLRKAAKRLADVEAARIVAETTASGDDGLALAYWEAEADRLERSANRNAALGRLHARQAEDARYELGKLREKAARS